MRDREHFLEVLLAEEIHTEAEEGDGDMMGPQMMGPGMMGGWGWFGVLWFALLIIATVAIVTVVLTRTTRRDDRPVDILRNRLARGEITREQFDELRHVLQ